MFCYQCQEAAKNTGCTIKGICGKQESTAELQDVLVHILKGIAVYGEQAVEQGVPIDSEALFVMQAMFATITNANFDDRRILALAKEALKVRDGLKARVAATGSQDLHDSATWHGETAEDFTEKAREVGIPSTENEDVRSLSCSIRRRAPVWMCIRTARCSRPTTIPLSRSTTISRATTEVHGGNRMRSLNRSTGPS